MRLRKGWSWEKVSPPPAGLTVKLLPWGASLAPASLLSLWFCRGNVSPVSRDLSSAMSGYTRDRSLPAYTERWLRYSHKTWRVTQMTLSYSVKTWRVTQIIIIIIIAFKGAIWDFLQSPHSAANCLQHARSSGPGAIVCKSRATHRVLITCNMSCYMPLGTKGQLSY